MAEAIAGAIYAAATSTAAVNAAVFIASNAAVINAALVVSASTAYSAANARTQRRRARDAYNAGLRDREVMVRTGVAPQRIIYGRDRVSGPVVYVESTGTRKEYLHLVVALAGHECDAIETVWFNDIALPAADGSGNINSGEFALTEATFGTTGETAASGGGTITLAHAATRVTAVVAIYGTGLESTGIPTGSYSHTAGSSTVSGLTAGQTYIVNYEYATTTSLVRVKQYLGTSTQTADADLVAESDGKWTTNHRGRGICYLYVRLKYHQDVFGAIGVPNISATVRGRKVWDPRSSTTVWSENAALCVADFLRNSEFGLGATSAQVPDSELITAANICDEDEEVTASTTQDRYTCNTSFTTDVDPIETLRALSAAMAGAAVWTQGRWLVRPGAYRTPTVTISEDSLADGAIVTVPKVSRSDLFNAVRLTHRDPDRDYVEAQAPLVENATYTSDDGGRQIVRDLKLQIACEPVRAQRLGRIELERARQALTVKLRCNLKAYDLAPTDTVLVTLARYGWSAKAFEVIDRTWAGAQLEYTLRETAAAVFDWNYGLAYTVDVAPDTTLPNPYTAPTAIADLSVFSDAGMAVKLSAGPAVSRAYVTWTASTDQFVQQGGRIDVEWAKSRDTVWQTQRVLGSDTDAWLLGVPAGDGIIVRVRPVNAAGRAGDWTYATHTVNGIGAAPSFGQFLESFSSGYGLWRNYTGSGERSIVDISDGEMGGRALRVGNGSGDDMAWMIHEQNIPYDPQALYRIRARVRRTSGSGTLYVGVAGVLADGITLCNRNGADSYLSQHYVAASGAAPGSSWALYDGYFSDTAATGEGTTEHADPTDPAALHEDVRYVRPLLLCNYNGAAGIMEVDYVVVDRIRLTGDLAPYSVSEGNITDSSTTVGSSGSPGASVRAVTLWGPSITTAADDALDINVSGVLTETFWSQPTIASVELWLTWAATFGGAQTEFGTRRKFQVPLDVYTASSYIPLDMHGQIAPGAVTRDYVLRVSITYRDATGAAKQCAKDFSSDAQWRVVRRKR